MREESPVSPRYAPLSLLPQSKHIRCLFIGNNLVHSVITASSRHSARLCRKTETKTKTEGENEGRVREGERQTYKERQAERGRERGERG